MKAKLLTFCNNKKETKTQAQKMANDGNPAEDGFYGSVRAQHIKKGTTVGVFAFYVLYEIKSFLSDNGTIRTSFPNLA